jgi:hypothetical protein
MGDKAMEDLKQKMTKEVKLFAQNTDQICKKAKPLRDEEEELCKKKDPTPDDKKRVVDLRKALQDLEKSYLTQADNTSDRLGKLLQSSGPEKKEDIPDWQKSMAPWYRDMINKESGIDIGKDVKLWGDLSFKDKSATIYLKGKF